jgi:hypothetical protein
MAHKTNKGVLLNQRGMALIAVMFMLVVMTIIGMGMYKLIESTIGVSASYNRKAQTRMMAVAHGSLVMDTIANSVIAGNLILSPGLEAGKPAADILANLMGSDGNNYGDSAVLGHPNFAPDFILRRGNIISYADVDFVQSIAMSGGSIEFASAYDGVGQGQTMGSSFLIQQSVHIVSYDERTGTKSEIRFMADN